MLSSIKTEVPMNQADFTQYSSFVTPRGSLAFAQGAHDLKSLESGVSGFHGLEAERWLDEPFQLAVIGFDEVVEVFDLGCV